MFMYSYYYSASRFSLVISRSTTYAIDNSLSSNILIPKQRVSILPFQSRFSMTTNAPLRIRFQPSSSFSYNSGTPSYSGIMTINNNQISYSSNYLCYFRQYTTYTNMAQ